MSERRQSRDQRRGCFGVTVRHSKSRPYGLSDFQYLVVYVIPKDVWYIIPYAEVMARNTILLRPDDPPDNGYEKYREARYRLGEVPPPIQPGPLKRKPYRLEPDRVSKLEARKKSE
jgi:hypothetical protein